MMTISLVEECLKCNKGYSLAHDKCVYAYSLYAETVT